MSKLVVNSVRSRHLIWHLLWSSSVFVIFGVIYLCNYYDTRDHFLRHKYAKYGPIVKFKSRHLVAPDLWNTERDDTADDEDREEVIERSDRFDITADDVIVFLQIPNTGGRVFETHIVEDLLTDVACDCHRRRCRCPRPNRPHSQWLFSHVTTGTRCGTHPDFSELIHCADRVLDEEEGETVKRRYFYMTLLRDPIARFVSEFRHWRAQEPKAWRHWCGGGEEGEETVDLSMEAFVACDRNPALNRQTRMLSDRALVDSSSSSSTANESLLLLTSALNNVRRMSFFALNEFPRMSQHVFEQTFGLVFLDSRPHPSGAFRRSRRAPVDEFSAQTLDKIRAVNGLDLQLYQTAKELLFERFAKLKHKKEKKKSLTDGSREEWVTNWGDSEDNQLINRRI